MKPAPFLIIFFLFSLVLAALFANSPASPLYVELADAPAITVDWSNGATQAVTLHGNRAFTFINGQKGRTYLLIIKQDATGSRTVTWPASVHWPGDKTQPPTLLTTANKKDYASFFFDGETYDFLALSQGF